MKQKAYFVTASSGKEITFRQSVGEMVFAGIMYAIGYGSFFVAVGNLLFLRPLPLEALVCSLAWISIMVGIVVSDCRRKGVHDHLVAFFGNFIRNRFALFTTDESGDSILSFGYAVASRRYYFLKLRADGITSVDWGPGQGNIPGKDNDWNVAMWFDLSSIVFDGCQASLGIFIVGASGRKAGRETFGTSFIEFLTANGVRLNLPPRNLLGQLAEVVEPLQPLGRIRIGTNEYTARPIERMIEKGSTVAIEEIRGTSIYARQRSGPNQASEVSPRKIGKP